MFARGHDLDDWLATPRRWPALLEILDRFPSDTWLNEAIDKATAEQRALSEDGKGKKASDWRPVSREWGLTQLQMAELINEVRDLKIKFISANTPKGKKAPDFKGFPTPKDPVEEFKAQKKIQGTKRLLSRMGA